MTWGQGGMSTFNSNTVEQIYNRNSLQSSTGVVFLYNYS